ncbi:AraC family transcriptional regulator [Brevibacterium senegalense]|uniref:AraC family transcriptional regulator n=1 Tax=Brevibacterium senegalense TaxID=1033736 RepID=UPI00031FC07A|nr:helix-turn-helix domain-containing protein [Brevibacterium senegalense]
MDGPPQQSSDGVLYPARLPTFHRISVTGGFTAFVRWFWFARWDVAPGRTSRQHLIGYPTSNLVVSDDRTEFSGPATRASHRDLTGTGWAVGALLQPASIPTVLRHVMAGRSGNPQDTAAASQVGATGTLEETTPTDAQDVTPRIAALRDTVLLVALPDLEAAVHAAMASPRPPADTCAEAARAFTAWLTALLGEPTEEGLLANRMVDAAETQRHLDSVTDLAAHLHVSQRTLQRLTATHVGLSPGMLIRRRRLHDGARRLREEPGLTLTDLAHELGYSDHAHLTHDWRTVLGITPTGYRRSAQSTDTTDPAR